jgi:hypothetical protein
MWIMIAGPYRAGSSGPAARAANLRKLNEVAVALHRAGHVPIIGVNMALPMIEAAGGADAAYAELMAPTSLALVDRCDACLRIGGPSTGADDEVVREGQPPGVSGARRSASGDSGQFPCVTL